MANQEHLDILKQGVGVWNRWRMQNPKIYPDLSNAHLPGITLRKAILTGTNLSFADLIDADLMLANLSRSFLNNADLTQADLTEADLFSAKLIKANLHGVKLKNANLRRADLSGVNLSGINLNRAVLCQINLSRAELVGTKFVLADLSGANLSGANLSEAELPGASLIRANLRGTNLKRAILVGSDLSGTNLRGADLREANLSRATLVGTNLREANLTHCSVYGISVWSVELEGAIQESLVITRTNEPIITVDNLKVAQFIYLLLNNQEIRDVIDTITSKVVLILGRFTSERKAILDALRDELRERNYSPVLFDFEKPASRDITETISTLAHIARFVIADITDAKSIPQELMLIVPNLPSVPVQPLILTSQHEYGMFEHFTRYPWVLPVYRYTDEASLLQSLQEKVITPAGQKSKELAKR